MIPRGARRVNAISVHSGESKEGEEAIRREQNSVLSWVIVPRSPCMEGIPDFKWVSRFRMHWKSSVHSKHLFMLSDDMLRFFLHFLPFFFFFIFFPLNFSLPFAGFAPKCSSRSVTLWLFLSVFTFLVVNFYTNSYLKLSSMNGGWFLYWKTSWT